MYKYDLFISHASENKDTANKIVEMLELRGCKCFIAPRDIRTGEEYAVEIVRGISNSVAVLLIFSKDSDQSGYVLREINSAVSRNKNVMPLRIEDFIPSEAMEFYLGPAHWLDAFPEILGQHLDKIINIVDAIKRKNEVAKEKVTISQPTLIKVSQISEIELSPRQLVAKEIELDYLAVARGDYIIDESIEGTLEDWVAMVNEEEDTSILLVQNDELIGYCTMYPMNDEDYNSLINGEKMIRGEMLELYSLGGIYNCYISMMTINPDFEKQQLYLMMFKWVTQHLKEWQDDNIEIKEIAISAYSPILDKFVNKFQFDFVGYNLAKGKIYKIKTSKLFEVCSSLFKK